MPSCQGGTGTDLALYCDSRSVTKPLLYSNDYRFTFLVVTTQTKARNGRGKKRQQQSLAVGCVKGKDCLLCSFFLSMDGQESGWLQGFSPGNAEAVLSHCYVLGLALPLIFM